MNFEDYLNEAWKRFAYSKDGVRKQVKNDREAEEWRATVAKPPKAPKAPREAKYNLSMIANIISSEVANYYPDSNGWDTIARKVIKLYPDLTLTTVHTVLDKATKTELKSKDFHAYVDEMHKQYAADLK